MILDSNKLLNKLQSLAGDVTPARWMVAFSGGIDSTVLLHALADSDNSTPVVAVHVDHALHADSQKWALHCKRVATDLSVAYVGLEVAVRDRGAHGPEAAARSARYAAFREIILSNDCLISAHHQNDQAETLLLNLMRGSGVAGLAGIGASQSFGKGRLLRPLLDVPLQSIKCYAEEKKLDWLEDPSNIDTRYDRNFLRLEIIPALAKRWPAVSDRLTRSAELVGEANELLTELANSDLECVGTCNRLSISRLQDLSRARQRNVLRRAVRLCGLPAPPGTRLQQVVDELIPARADAQPLVSWEGVNVRRYRDDVFILPSGNEPLPPASEKILPDQGRLVLSPGLGALELVAAETGGISAAIAEAGLELRFRTGGEEIRVSGRESTQKLKKLLQDSAVLPWMRARVPLLYAGDKLVAVADMWVDAECTATPGYVVKWHDGPKLM